MLNLRNATVFAVLACAATVAALPRTESADGPAPASVYSLEAPPAAIADALSDITDPDAKKRDKAARVLRDRAEAEPYLRRYCLSKVGKANVEAREAFEALEAARAVRNGKRLPDWAKAGRYDLLVDAGIHLTETEQADALGELLFNFAKEIRPIAEKLGGPEARHHLDHSMKRFDENQRVRRLHDPQGTVETETAWLCYVRAQSCKASKRLRQNWLIVTRNELVGTAELSNQWENCYIFHNGDITFDNCVWSLVVCDGNIEFVNIVDGHAATIIANGSIHSATGLKFELSTYWARGDIVAKGSNTRTGLLLAGGKIDVPKLGLGKDSKERIEKAGVKENPFGVRFFDSADVGVEVAVKSGAVTIAKLTAGSPLTKYGLKEGDAVTQVNEKPIKSANDLRRELRYSVALEAGIFHITRGDEKITRLVYFKNGLEK